ncbi:MAG: cellulose biosynthesis protein BcsP [Pigmentiphaga sp.]|nr:cellulose biosynthesis protein BcsP [Pigmentiphaga sp.]
MSNANDIKNLFAKFGGKPEGYRELALENDAAHSRARWPMLNAISPEHAEHPPGVTQASQPASRRRPYLGFGSVRQSHVEPGSATPPQASAPKRPSGFVPFGEPGRRQAPSSSRGPDAAGAPTAPAPVAGVALAVTRTVPAPGPRPTPAVVRRAGIPDAVSPIPSADGAMPAREPLSIGANTPRAEPPSVKSPTSVQRTLRRLSQAASQAPASEPPAPAVAPEPAAAPESGLAALFARLARR